MNKNINLLKLLSFILELYFTPIKKGKDKKRNINTKRKTNETIHSLTWDWIKGIKEELN